MTQIKVQAFDEAVVSTQDFADKLVGNANFILKALEQGQLKGWVTKEEAAIMHLAITQVKLTVPQIATAYDKLKQAAMIDPELPGDNRALAIQAALRELQQAFTAFTQADEITAGLEVLKRLQRRNISVDGKTDPQSLLQLIDPLARELTLPPKEEFPSEKVDSLLIMLQQRPLKWPLLNKAILKNLPEATRAEFVTANEVITAWASSLNEDFAGSFGANIVVVNDLCSWLDEMELQSKRSDESKDPSLIAMAKFFNEDPLVKVLDLGKLAQKLRFEHRDVVAAMITAEADGDTAALSAAFNNKYLNRLLKVIAQYRITQATDPNLHNESLELLIKILPKLQAELITDPETQALVIRAQAIKLTMKEQQELFEALGETMALAHRDLPKVESLKDLYAKVFPIAKQQLRDEASQAAAGGADTTEDATPFDIDIDIDAREQSIFEYDAIKQRQRELVMQQLNKGMTVDQMLDTQIILQAFELQELEGGFFDAFKDSAAYGKFFADVVYGFIDGEAKDPNKSPHKILAQIQAKHAILKAGGAPDLAAWEQHVSAIIKIYIDGDNTGTYLHEEEFKLAIDYIADYFAEPYKSELPAAFTQKLDQIKVLQIDIAKGQSTATASIDDFVDSELAQPEVTDDLESQAQLLAQSLQVEFNRRYKNTSMAVFNGGERYDDRIKGAGYGYVDVADLSSGLKYWVELKLATAQSPAHQQNLIRFFLETIKQSFENYDWDTTKTIFSALNAYIDDPRFKAVFAEYDTGSYDAFDFQGQAVKLPLLQAIKAVSSGDANVKYIRQCREQGKIKLPDMIRDTNTYTTARENEGFARFEKLGSIKHSVLPQLSADVALSTHGPTFDVAPIAEPATVPIEIYKDNASARIVQVKDAFEIAPDASFSVLVKALVNNGDQQRRYPRQLDIRFAVDAFENVFAKRFEDAITAIEELGKQVLVEQKDTFTLMVQRFVDSEDTQYSLENIKKLKLAIANCEVTKLFEWAYKDATPDKNFNLTAMLDLCNGFVAKFEAEAAALLADDPTRLAEVQAALTIDGLPRYQGQDNLIVKVKDKAITGRKAYDAYADALATAIKTTEPSAEQFTRVKETLEYLQGVAEREGVAIDGPVRKILKAQFKLVTSQEPVAPELAEQMLALLIANQNAFKAGKTGIKYKSYRQSFYKRVEFLARHVRSELAQAAAAEVPSPEEAPFAADFDAGTGQFSLDDDTSGFSTSEDADVRQSLEERQQVMADLSRAAADIARATDTGLGMTEAVAPATGPEALISTQATGVGDDRSELTAADPAWAYTASSSVSEEEEFDFGTEANARLEQPSSVVLQEDDDIDALQPHPETEPDQATDTQLTRDSVSTNAHHLKACDAYSFSANLSKSVEIKFTPGTDPESIEGESKPKKARLLVPHLPWRRSLAKSVMHDLAISTAQLVAEGVMDPAVTLNISKAGDRVTKSTLAATKELYISLMVIQALSDWNAHNPDNKVENIPDLSANRLEPKLPPEVHAQLKAKLPKIKRKIAKRIAQQLGLADKVGVEVAIQTSWEIYKAKGDVKAAALANPTTEIDRDAPISNHVADTLAAMNISGTPNLGLEPKPYKRALQVDAEGKIAKVTKPKAEKPFDKSHGFSVW